jgi:hypothetical protein
MEVSGFWLFSGHFINGLLSEKLSLDWTCSWTLDLYQFIALDDLLELEVNQTSIVTARSWSCSFFCMEAFVANCQSAFQMKSSKIVFCPALSIFSRGLVFWVTLIICCLVMKFCVGYWLCGVFVFELLLEACHDGGLDHTTSSYLLHSDM